jgi:hypothetical protein
MKKESIWDQKRYFQQNNREVSKKSRAHFESENLPEYRTISVTLAKIYFVEHFNRLNLKLSGIINSFERIYPQSPS